uniref:Carboxylesterase type B domain-containing protein n=1 Tax=Lutzomyia longipalpis TaxID=7200 RepID=A0A1B0F029_LUTLO
MSASATGQWSPPQHQLELAEKQARLFNCTTATPHEMVMCLQNVDALEMGRRLPEMFEWGKGNPVLLWKPLFSDSTIGFSVHRFAELTSRHSKVFYYKHTFRGRYSFFYYPESKPYAPTFGQNDPENLNVERMTRMWTTFAEKGNPNDPTDEYLKVLKWTPYSPLLDNYLEIGNEENFAMKQGLYADRYSIWDELFPLPVTNKSQHL